MATQTSIKGKTKTAQSSTSSTRQEPPIDAARKMQLHTIIFFPIDYDDPGNKSATEIASADKTLSTGPHQHIVRVPALQQRSLGLDEMPYYFQDEHFERVEGRLRSIYFKDVKIDRTTRFEERHDTYAAKAEGGNEDVAQRFLHQMPVFMRMLEQKGFRTIYARNLRSAIRHARRLKSIIAPESPINIRSATTPGEPPLTADSHGFNLSPTTTPGIPVPEQKVMLLNYRNLGTRIQMDSRAFDALLGESVVPYPTRDEVALDSAKIYDLMAFDKCAKKDHLWRPAWHECDLRKATEGRRECPWEGEAYRRLWDQKDNRNKFTTLQVLKRGHSSCTSKVRIVPTESCREPACYKALVKFHKDLKDEDLRDITKESRPGMLPKRGENHILHNARFYNYIHQEYVESLDSWGELRVFVRMKTYEGDDGVSRRRPQVVDIIKTHFNQQEIVKRFRQRFGPREGQNAPIIKQASAAVKTGNPGPIAAGNAVRQAPAAAGRNNNGPVPYAEQSERQRRDRGYGQDLTAKTAAQLRKYLKLRGFPGHGKTRKETMIGILQEDEQRQQGGPAEDADGGEQQRQDSPNQDEVGQPPAADDEEDDASPVNPAAPQDPGDGDGDEDLPFRLPDEGPIVRCTYYSANVNVSRLDMSSNQPFASKPHINIPAIKRFALTQYRHLLRRFPQRFESLNVGARVDIGVGPKEELFINEVTRWWFANWFSGFEDVEHQDRVVQAFADSFAEVYEAVPKGDGEADPESGDDDDDYDGGEEQNAVLYKQKREVIGSRRENRREDGGEDEGGDESGNGGGNGGGAGGAGGAGGGPAGGADQGDGGGNGEGAVGDDGVNHDDDDLYADPTPPPRPRKPKPGKKEQRKSKRTKKADTPPVKEESDDDDGHHHKNGAKTNSPKVKVEANTSAPTSPRGASEQAPSRKSPRTNNTSNSGTPTPSRKTRAGREATATPPRRSQRTAAGTNEKKRPHEEAAGSSSEPEPQPDSAVEESPRKRGRRGRARMT